MVIFAMYSTPSKHMDYAANYICVSDAVSFCTFFSRNLVGLIGSIVEWEKALLI